MDGTTDYEYDWSRIEAMLKTWPGLSRRPSPAELEALVTAYAYPNGRDRASRCDPLELEDALRELIQEDEKGSHPMPRVVAARVGLIRLRAHPSVGDALEPLERDEPAEAWVLAHAIARGSATMVMMRALARRHGRDEHPVHNEATCPLCERERLLESKRIELAATHGEHWRRVFEAQDELRAYALELDQRFPWAVGLEA